MASEGQTDKEDGKLKVIGDGVRAMEMSVSQVIVAIDPGRDKCGVAVVTVNGRTVSKDVVDTANVLGFIRSHITDEQVKAYALGDGTADEAVRHALLDAGVEEGRIIPVDEYKSSEIGRRAYWVENPPKGWRRLIPIGLQVPPQPYDDFVAVELARRFLEEHSPGSKRIS